MITQTLKQKADCKSGFLSWQSMARREQLEIGEFLTLGRGPENQLSFADPYLSERHARIERKDQGFLLRDLRSRNGSYVNGARIHETFLNDGDRVQIGETSLYFSVEQERALTGNLVSKNIVWNAQLSRLPSIAESEFPILLNGESGTGKDVLAQSIHHLSPRRSGPFVSVNCSALSESLVESELFGHVRGSFTGATENRKGAFEAARGGTLFLDEIGDLPLSLQPKLLRALENNRIRPVGSDRDIDTNVRIIAATHHDLRRQVSEERFRADLFFRLHVIQIKAPALKERLEDFDDIFYSFARKMRVRFSHGAIQYLKEHSWPGNIRELRNVVSRAKAYWGSELVDESRASTLLDRFEDTEDLTLASKPGQSVIREIELEMIKNRLVANKGNQRKTASDLGMPKSTLHDRIRHYGIDLSKIKA